MRKAIQKDFFREIKFTLNRYLSILFIVALGVAFFAGIRATSPDMKKTLDNYLDATNYMDIRVLSTLGLTDEDLEAIAAVEGVQAVDGAYSYDAWVLREDEKRILRFLSEPDGINEMDLVDGRGIEQDDECVVDEFLVSKFGYAIGDTLEITAAGEDEDVGDTLTRDTYTIVGVATSSSYFTVSRDTTSVGTGQTEAFVYLSKDVFKTEAYSAAYILAAGAADEEAFSEQYEAVVEAVTDRLDAISGEREAARYDGIMTEAESEIADAKSELAEAKAEAESELADAWQQITDGEQELADGRRELADSRADYESQIADAKAEIADGERELDDGQAEIDANARKLADGRAQIADAEAQLDSSAETINENKALYESGLASANEGQSKLDEGYAQLTAAADEMEAQTAALMAQREGLISQQEELQAALAQLDGGIGGLEQVMDELKPQRESLNKGLNEMTSAAGQLEESLSSAEDGAGELSAQIASAGETAERLQKEITAGETEAGKIKEAISAAEAEGNEEEAARLRTELADLESKIQELKNDLSACQSEKESLEAQLSGLQTQIETLKGQLEELRPQIETLTEQLEQLDAQLESLEGQRDDLLAQRGEVQTGMEQLASGLARIDDGLKQLADGQTLLEGQKKELDEQQALLTASFDELAAAKAQLDEGERQLADGRSQLYSKKQEISEGEAALSSARQELADGRKLLAESRQELQDKMAEAEQEFSDAETELADGESELADAREEYASGKQEAESEIADAEAEIADAEAELADLEYPEWYVLDRNSTQGYVEYEQNADRIYAIGRIFPLIFFLVAALISLTTMTRMVESQRIEIGTLKALGYSNWAIAKKYVLYALSASAIGSLIGLLFGQKFLPWIIITTYKILYPNLPEVLTPLSVQYSVMASAAAIICVTGAAFAACYKELLATPAELMRPVAPKAGRKIWLEYVGFLWRRLKFTSKVALRNLFRYKKRFFMTIFGIGGCTALVLFGFGLTDSISGVVVRQYEDLFHYDMTLTLEEHADEEELQELHDYLEDNDTMIVEQYTLLRSRSMEIKGAKANYTAYLTVPSNPAQYEAFAVLQDREKGTLYHLDDETVIITEKLSDLLDVKPGDTMTITDLDEDREVTVGAIAENYLMSYVYMSPKLYEKIFGEAPEWNTVEAFIPDMNDDNSEEYSTELLKLSAVSATTTTDYTRSKFEDVLGSLDIITLIVVAAAGMLAFIVLYNLNNINITERRREMATIKVLGFYDLEVAEYVYRENIMLTIIGAVLGLVFGKYLHAFIITTVETDIIMFIRHADVSSYVYAVLITFGFSMFVNWMMYYRLKKIDMVESLKSVE